MFIIDVLFKYDIIDKNNKEISSRLVILQRVLISSSSTKIHLN